MPFKPSTDFAAVGVMMYTYMVLVASAALPDKDGKGFAEAARLKPFSRSMGAPESLTRILAYKFYIQILRGPSGGQPVCKSQ